MDRYGILLVFVSLQLSVSAQLFNLSRGSCPENHLSCLEGKNWRSSDSNNVCFHEKHLCDNETDCTDSSDEKFCPGNFNYGQEGFVFRFIQGPCLSDRVMCVSGTANYNSTDADADKRCIPKRWVCNDNVHCLDGSDEKYCPYNFTTGFTFKFVQHDCPQGYYRCRTGSTVHSVYLLWFRPGARSTDNVECIPKSKICDNRDDCMDGSDEKFCPYFFPEDLIAAPATSDNQSQTTTEGTQPVESTECDVAEERQINDKETLNSISDSIRQLVVVTIKKIKNLFCLSIRVSS